MDRQIKVTQCNPEGFLVCSGDEYRLTIDFAHNSLLYHELLKYSDSASQRQWWSELSNMSFKSPFKMRE